MPLFGYSLPALWRLWGPPGTLAPLSASALSRLPSAGDPGLRGAGR